MDIKKLILLVQRHEAIYDLSNVYHRNKERITSLWKDIAVELNSTDDEAKRKWCNLRSNYMREKRRLQKKIDNGVVQPKIRWPYYNLLKFVDEAWDNTPSVDGGNTTSRTFKSFSNDNDSFSLNDPTLETVVDEKHQVAQESLGAIYVPDDKNQLANENVAEYQTVRPNDNVAKYQTGRKRRTIISTTDDDNDDVHKTYINNSKCRCLNRGNEYHDPDFMFLRSILPTMRKLETFESLEFKSEVIDLLKKKLQQQINHNEGYTDPPPTVRINLDSKLFFRQSPSRD